MSKQLLPGHTEYLSIGAPAEPPMPTTGWADRHHIAQAACEMAEQGVDARMAYRMAIHAGWNQAEAAWITKLVKTSGWREILADFQMKRAKAA